MEGADIYQIAKNCRTSVEMIERFYAAHIKTTLDAAAINVSQGAAQFAPRRRESDVASEAAPRRKHNPILTEATAHPAVATGRDCAWCGGVAA